METDVCFFGKSSATHPSHTKTADVGFWLFPRAKVYRKFQKKKSNFTSVEQGIKVAKKSRYIIPLYCKKK